VRAPLAAWVLQRQGAAGARGAGAVSGTSCAPADRALRSEWTVSKFYTMQSQSPAPALVPRLNKFVRVQGLRGR